MSDATLAPEQAWLAVVTAYQTCTAQYERMVLELGLTIPQCDVLGAIRSLGDEALPKHIANRLLVTRGNISGLLRRLERDDLITMHAHPLDGRARICKLTTAGAILEQRVREAARRFIQAQLAPFGPDDLVITYALMTRMTAHLKTLDPVALADPAKEKE